MENVKEIILKVMEKDGVEILGRGGKWNKKAIN